MDRQSGAQSSPNQAMAKAAKVLSEAGRATGSFDPLL
jgi:hypothetical protein